MAQRLPGPSLSPGPDIPAARNNHKGDVRAQGGVREVKGGLVEGRGLQQVGLSDSLITLPSPPHLDLLVPPWSTDYLTIATVLLFFSITVLFGIAIPKSRDGCFYSLTLWQWCDNTKEQRAPSVYCAAIAQCH